MSKPSIGFHPHATHCGETMIEIAGFDWDEWNLDVCERLGVVRSEIETMLLGTPRIGPAAGPQGLRIAVGTCASGRWLLVAFRLEKRQGRDWLRPVAARYLRHAEVLELDQDGDTQPDR